MPYYRAGAALANGVDNGRNARMRTLEKSFPASMLFKWQSSPTGRGKRGWNRGFSQRPDCRIRATSRLYNCATNHRHLEQEILSNRSYYSHAPAGRIDPAGLLHSR
jgi:hypothetical protein